jgi:hypothetical protein
MLRTYEEMRSGPVLDSKYIVPMPENAARGFSLAGPRPTWWMSVKPCQPQFREPDHDDADGEDYCPNSAYAGNSSPIRIGWTSENWTLYPRYQNIPCWKCCSSPSGPAPFS